MQQLLPAPQANEPNEPSEPNKLSKPNKINNISLHSLERHFTSNQEGEIDKKKVQKKINKK